MAFEWATATVTARQSGDALVTRRTVSPGVYAEAMLDATSFAIASEVATSIAALITAIDLKQDSSEKGQPDGYAPLDSGGKIPANFLPGFVDDFLEFANLAAFPVTGETGKMYLAIDTGKTYRWTGSVYGEISASPGSTDAVPEGVANLYFTQSRVRTTVLTGYVEAIVAAVVDASDTVLSAFGKLSKLIADRVVGPSSATDNGLVRFDGTSGKLVQDGLVALEDDGAMTFPAISTPSVPGASKFKLFGRNLSGRMLPAVIGPSGLDTSLQPLFGSNSIAYAIARGASAVIDPGGILITVTGVATVANATTGYWGRVRKMEMLVTTPATNAVAGYRGTGRLWTVGSDVDGTGGFFFIQRWGAATGVTNSTNRAYAGFAPLTVAPTDANPSSRTDIVGMGWDNGDTNIQMFHNDGSGTATKIDTGIVKPSADRTDILELVMFSPPSTTQSVTWRITNMTTGDQASGVITTDLPSTTQFLNVYGYTSAGGTSSVTGFAFRSIYVETDQ